MDGACVPSCGTATPCGAGYKCLEVAGALQGGCVVDTSSPQCSTTVPCSSGEICTSGLCTSACTTNSQCADGKVCNGTSGLCVPNQSVKHCGPGAAEQCIGDQVCAGDGYCHYPCTIASDCVVFDARFVVCGASRFCETELEANPECTLQAPCPIGYNCVSNQCQ